MNDRIKLPDQEWLGYDPEKGDIHGYTFDQMREFAALIIQECAQVGEDTDGNWNVRYNILKHFGVK